MGEIVLSAGHVAADHGWVVLFQLRRAAGVACEDAVAKARGETFDLLLDAIGHVGGAAGGNVAVGPTGVLAGGSAGGVDQGLLCDEHERAFGRLAVHHFGFGTKNFVVAAADMNGGGLAAGGVAPRNGLRQGPIDFEDGGTVAKTKEAIAVGCGQFVAGDAGELMGTQVEDEGASGRKFAQAGDWALKFEGSAVVFESANEGGDDLLRTAAGAGPVDGVCNGGEHEAEGGGAGAVERHHGVGGATGEEGASGVGFEAGANQLFAGAEAEQAETRGGEKMARVEMPDRTEQRADEILAGERAEETCPGARVGSEMLGGGFD